MSIGLSAIRWLFRLTRMCGIIATTQAGMSKEEVHRGLSSLGHRGPDGRQLWKSAKHGVLLGHTRLSIIDPAGGPQPIENETNDIAVIVNGEFYDYEQTMARLMERGHRFRTKCDSEILLHLYEDYQLTAVNYLRGEFAFVIWDEKNARLIAGRDRFGIKPLFYTLYAGELWLASEAKALFAMGLPAEWDEASFYNCLFLIHGPGQSLFAGVQQLEPGHLLLFEAGRLSIRRYWDLDYPPREESASANQDELISSFWDELADSVRVRLRADTPVGYYLSGGIDSSTVLGLASQFWASPGRAFTVRFDEPAYDEGAVASATAQRFGASFTPVMLDGENLAAAYPDAIAQGEMVGNFHAAARYLQSRAVHQAGYKVAMTGDGADEVLAGYVHYARDICLSSQENTPAALRPLQQRLGHVPQWVRMLAIERSVFHLMLSRDYRERMAGREPYIDCMDRMDFDGQLAGRHPLHQSLYLWNKMMLPNYVLAAERLEMAFAVETRPPFLDHILFDSIRRLPASSLVCGRQGKQPLRLAARSILPDSVLVQQKHPFAAPSRLSDSSSALFRRVDEVFRGGTLRCMPFFDEQSVLGIWEQLPHLPELRRTSLEPVLLIIFGACVLHRRYVSKQPWTA